MDKEKIIKQYEKYIYKIAKGYAKGDDDLFEDLQQECRIAICRAVDNYNPNSTTSFHVYLTYYLFGYMKRFLAMHLRTIRPSHNILYGPNFKENVFLSIDAPLSEEFTIGDIILDPDTLEDNSDDDAHVNKVSKLYRNINKLNPKYKQIIYMRILEEKTFVEIGEEINCTHQNANRVYYSAISKLKKMINNE